MNTITLKLSVKQVPVELEGTDSQLIKCRLVEMDAAARDEYLESFKSRMNLAPDGKAVGVNNFKGMQADLVSRCLVKVGASEKELFFSVEEIQKWPASAVAQLFQAAQELNRIAASADTPEKND